MEKQKTQQATRNGGWIKLHRKLKGNFLWKEPRTFSKAEAWIDILFEARYLHDHHEVVIRSKTLYCHYGETLKSIETWAGRWQWNRSAVWRFLKQLAQCGMVITKNEGVTMCVTVCNYETYQGYGYNETVFETVSETVNPLENKGLAEDSETVSETVFEHRRRRNIKKERNSSEYRLSKLLLDCIVERKANFTEGQEPRRKGTIQKWAVDIERLIRIDKRTPEQVEAVIRWCQQDSFWQRQVLSGKNLRKHIDKLEDAMGASNSKTPTAVPVVRGADGLTAIERHEAQMERNRKHAS